MSKTILFFAPCAFIAIGCSARHTETTQESTEGTSSALISADGRYAMVTGQSQSDPTYVGDESETSMTISPIAGTNQAVATVTYNDGSNNGTLIQYTNTSRTVFPGVSLMGWSSVVYDTTQSFSKVGAWTYGGKVPPPAGFAALWGDPSSTAVPGTPYVFIANLAMPTSKFPASGSITGFVGGAIGGACIARSSDNGRTFAIDQCISDTASNANGDFYDGSTMAATSDGRVFAAFNDTDTSQIDVWGSPSATGTFTQLPNPFPGLVSALHPRLRSQNTYLFVAAPMANANVPGQVDLWMNLWVNNQWQTPVLVASNIATDQQLQVTGSFAGSAQSWRRAGMFSFDAGRESRNHNDSIRVAVTIPDPVHVLQIATFGCITSGGKLQCIRTPEWDPPSTLPSGGEFAQGTNFSPIVRATATSGPAADPTWALMFEMIIGGDTVQSNGYFMDVSSNGARQIIPAGGNNAEKPWWPQGPCPSVAIDSTQFSNTYEGDYDDMQVASESWSPDGTIHPYFFGTETNTLIPADLNQTNQPIGCQLQQQFVSSPVHVAVNMFATQ